MSTYAFRDAAGDVVLMAPQFARPIPVHAQTPAALAAVESVREDGRVRRAQQAEDRIVTDHGRPPVEVYAGDVVTKNARKLEAKARANGWQTKIVVASDRCVVEGVKPSKRLGFRAVWIKGKAAGASWHQGPRDRYVMVDDPRPVGINKVSRTGLAGKRPAGVDSVHLKLVASPRGVHCSITELEGRI